MKARNKRQRDAALDAYGRACACCGEIIERFLTIDHINNDGAHHRKTGGKDLPSWLARNGYPEGFQVLCYNCNIGRHQNGGTCPHKSTRSQDMAGSTGRR